MNTNVKKNRILLVVRWPIGGIRTFLSDVYRHFAGLDYEFYIILPQLSEHKILMRDLEALKATFITIPPNMPQLAFVTSIFITIKKYKINLIHSHGLTAAILSILLSKLLRVPHLSTFHELFYEKDFQGKKGSFKRQILSHALSNIDVIHLVSDTAKENILQFFPRLRNNDTRLITIPNGINIERFITNTSRDFRSELGISDDFFLIGFLGRFMPVKGFNYLVDSLDILRKRSCEIRRRPLLLTFGWGAYIREEMESAKRRGLDDSIVSLPFSTDICSTLRGLDLVAMPSLSEACGLLAAEAIASGVPIIGTDCPGLREVMVGSPNVSVPVGDAEALAEAIIRQINHPTRVITEKYRSRAAKRFDVRRQSSRLARIYSQILDLQDSGLLHDHN